MEETILSFIIFKFLYQWEINNQIIQKVTSKIADSDWSKLKVVSAKPSPKSWTHPNPMKSFSSKTIKWAPHNFNNGNLNSLRISSANSFYFFLSTQSKRKKAIVVATAPLK